MTPAFPNRARRRSPCSAHTERGRAKTLLRPTLPVVRGWVREIMALLYVCSTIGRCCTRSIVFVGILRYEDDRVVLAGGRQFNAGRAPFVAAAHRSPYPNSRSKCPAISSNCA
jgi:hypothetical protein